MSAHLESVSNLEKRAAGLKSIENTFYHLRFAFYIEKMKQQLNTVVKLSEIRTNSEKAQVMSTKVLRGGILDKTHVAISITMAWGSRIIHESCKLKIMY